MRVSSHNLSIETLRRGRNRIPRNERICYFCGTDIEDEFHFIIVCKKYTDLRERYIPKKYYGKPSMYKLIELLKSNNRKILLDLGNFITLALKRRNFDNPVFQI